MCLASLYVCVWRACSVLHGTMCVLVGMNAHYRFSYFTIVPSHRCGCLVLRIVRSLSGWFSFATTVRSATATVKSIPTYTHTYTSEHVYRLFSHSIDFLFHADAIIVVASPYIHIRTYPYTYGHETPHTITRKFTDASVCADGFVGCGMRHTYDTRARFILCFIVILSVSMCLFVRSIPFMERSFAAADFIHKTTRKSGSCLSSSRNFMSIRCGI